MAKTKNDMLTGSIWKTILIFFFPVMVGTLFQQLYNTVDAMVVGNFVGKQALAAVGGSTGTVINLLVGFVTGLSSGATVVIAQYYGNQEQEGVKKGVDNGMFVAITLGIVLMISGILFAPEILRLLNVPEDIFPYSLTYLRIYLLGLIPSMIYNTGAGILRAVGDSKRPLYFLIVSCIVNIILDIVFVIGLHLDILGVGIATMISQLISCYLTMRVLANTQDIYAFHLFEMKLDHDVLLNIVKIGLPVGIQACLYGFANLFIQAGVNTYGTDTVAAYTAFGKIDALFWNFSGALGTAALTFAGQNFGAGNVQRVKKGIVQSAVMYVMISGMIALFCYFFGEYFYRLFTPDAAVISIGVQLLRFMCLFWPTFVFVEILSSSIRACGDSLFPMIITMFGIGFLRIFWIVFVPGQTIFDTLRCYPVSWILTSTLFLLYYVQGGWLKRALRQRSVLMEKTI